MAGSSRAVRSQHRQAKRCEDVRYAQRVLAAHGRPTVLQLLQIVTELMSAEQNISVSLVYPLVMKLAAPAPIIT